MSTTLTRTKAGTTVPAPGTYNIDPSHSSVDFEVRHLGLSKVRGGFEAFSGSVTVDDDPAKSKVDVAIDTASFTTGNEDRDGHVKGPDFLEVEAHPSLTFVSTGVRQDGSDWQVDGELTIKGLSLPVALDVDFEGAATDPWGNDRIAFSATTEIDRDEFGITWNEALETGGFLLGRKVKVTIEVQAVAQS